jgi:hypothetical protein
MSHAGLIPGQVLKAKGHEEWEERQYQQPTPKEGKLEKLPSAFGTPSDNTRLTHHSVHDFSYTDEIQKELQNY